MRLFFLSLIFFFSLFADGFIQPIPAESDYDPAKAELGKSLYFDPALSADGTISCANCHQPTLYGTDNLRFSIGIQGQTGTINAPSVFNSRYNLAQFWDGRAKTLQEQAKAPMVNPVEMGNTHDQVISTLKKNLTYQQTFKTLYPKKGITIDTVADAITEFEKALTTPNSPFDRYLRGDQDAISSEAKEGYELFKAKGCISCHNGINIGGNLYQKFGIFKEYNTTNLGRFNVTQKEYDKYFFKVPSLRNVEKTAPYFHEGDVKTLNEAVKMMGEFQLGRLLKPDEIDKIVAFLQSLTGEIPEIAFP